MNALSWSIMTYSVMQYLVMMCSTIAYHISSDLA